jgi:hypothetical protein
MNASAERGGECSCECDVLFHYVSSVGFSL